jgi:hypothetical protein
MINAKVLLPQREILKSAKVKGRNKDSDGNITGTYNSNPLLNSLLYDVEFPDSAIRQYVANTIAQNMYAQVDSEGFSTSILESIFDHAKDENAVPKSASYISTPSGQRHQHHTTAGWKFLVRFKDGDEMWVPLKLLKENNPIEVAEFVTAQGTSDEPAFSWWVPYILHKCDCIVSAVNSHVQKQTHKYGIEVPTNAKHATEIDKNNCNTYWQDAISLEMRNLVCAFRILDTHEPLPVGFSKSSGHFVFDIKMDFTRKARWVKDGHKHAEPISSTYARVVSECPYSIDICSTE